MVATRGNAKCWFSASCPCSGETTPMWTSSCPRVVLSKPLPQSDGPPRTGNKRKTYPRSAVHSHDGLWRDSAMMSPPAARIVQKDMRNWSLHVACVCPGPKRGTKTSRAERRLTRPLVQWDTAMAVLLQRGAAPLRQWEEGSMCHKGGSGIGIGIVPIRSAEALQFPRRLRLHLGGW